MLYAGDRKDASQQIKEWLDLDRVVLLDRYTYSNIAYQCAKLDAPEKQERLMKWILNLEFSHFGIPRPDINIFLDVPFSFTEKKLSSSRSGKDRNYLNGTTDIHEESLAFQKKVREIYLKIAEKDDNLGVINCSDEKDQILPAKKISGLIINFITDKIFNK